MNTTRLAYFHEETGVICHIVEYSNELIHEAYLNLPAFHLMMEVDNEIEPWTHYIDVLNDDIPERYPPKPHEACQWVGDDWFDPRTPSEVEADNRFIREQATKTKAEILSALMTRKIMTPQQVMQATSGIPVDMHEGFQAMPPELQAFILTEWMTRSVFGRMDPVVAIAGMALGLDDEDLDEIFGVRLNP